MKKLFTTFFIAAGSMFLFHSTAFAVSRSWIGSGSGGAGTDFNTSTNWSPNGVPSAADDLTMTFTSTCTITLSANASCNNLTITGNVCNYTILRVMGFTLTVNGTAQISGLRYCNPASYNITELDAVNGSFVFNGGAYFSMPGDGGNVYLLGNTSSPGDFVFNGSLIRFGTYCQTSPGTEPDMIFNRAGAQTIRCVNTSYHVKGESLTFGTTNSPTVTITGRGSYKFQPYDGNCTIGAGSTVTCTDCTLVNYHCTMQRYVSGGGTFTMGANSTFNYGTPNVSGGFSGFSTYSLSASSTVDYFSVGWQDMQPITYGNVICDGSASVAAKYSNGAQTMQGNFTVQNSAEYIPWLAGGLTIQGNTLLQTSGVFNATGDNTVPNITHTFQGNFTNNSSFTSGSPVGINTALFNGTGNQTIGGTVSTTFYNLTENKTSGTLYLGINTTVGTSTTTGVMNFQAGAMDLNAFTLTITQNASGAITRTSGYAISENTSNNSKITWQMGSSTGAHVFPFGRSTGTYIPFTFNPTSGTANDVTISTYHTTPNNSPLPSSPTVVTNLASTTGLSCSFGGPNANCDATADRFWQITVSGTPTATVIFGFDPAELEAAPYNGTQNAQRYSSATNQWQPASGTQTYGTGAYNWVQVAGVTTFSPWALASIVSPLPIELSVFTANYDPNSGVVNLGWTTATETNNDYFTVERSQNGTDFETVVDHIPGHGSTNEPHNYSSIDEKPFKGVSYYRLRQTDFDGKISYSQMEVINVDGNVSEGLAVFPNPSKDDAYISFNSTQDGVGVLKIYDVTGNLVYSATVEAQVGSNSVHINVAGLSKGLYLSTLILGNEKELKKSRFIKE